jgi:hypothetical protein
MFDAKGPTLQTLNYIYETTPQGSNEFYFYNVTDRCNGPWIDHSRFTQVD